MKAYSKRYNRALLAFYLLVGYVILQFSWWAFHIFSLAKEVNDDEQFVHRKILMIAGEALVFFVILGIGIYLVRKSFKREIELSIEKRNFMLSVTHELKTPIASSKLFAETLLTRNVDEQKKKDIIEKIFKDQTRLQKLVENILLASQVDGNTLVLKREKINVLDFVKSIVNGLESNNKVEFNIPVDLSAYVDRFYFTSVIQNLHENAIKYSNAEGKISWNALEDNNRIIISILDEGVGIPNEKKQRVFDLFHRIGDEDVRETKGTGVGLYIVNQIVTMHQGTIKIKNNTPKGSVFELELPL